jgi:hypothetical protein
MRLAAADRRLARWEELLDELTPRQVTVLQAFHQLEGFGESREDRRAAVSASVIASSMGAKVDTGKLLAAMSPANAPKAKAMSPDEVARGMSRLRTE